MAKTTEQIIECIESQLKKVGDCLVWQGGSYSDGYGGKAYKGRMYTVHRLMYLLKVGDIPDGHYVCHTCNNKKCCNVLHLYLANHQTNIEHAGRDGLMSKKKTYLTPKQADEIRERNKNGEGYRSIAKDYGVSHIAVRCAVKRIGKKYQ